MNFDNNKKRSNVPSSANQGLCSIISCKNYKRIPPDTNFFILKHANQESTIKFLTFEQNSAPLAWLKKKKTFPP